MLFSRDNTQPNSEEVDLTYQLPLLWITCDDGAFSEYILNLGGVCLPSTLFRITANMMTDCSLLLFGCNPYHREGRTILIAAPETAVRVFALILDTGTIAHWARSFFHSPCMPHLTGSLRGSSVKFGTIQRRLAWPLRKDDTHKSRSVNISFNSMIC